MFLNQIKALKTFPLNMLQNTKDYEHYKIKKVEGKLL